MGSRWGSELRCAVCGFRYADLRTGDTFASIKLEMKAGDPADSTTWRYRRRHGVLGYWHAKKLQWWKYHLASCEAAAQGVGDEQQDRASSGHAHRQPSEVEYPESWDDLPHQQPSRRRGAGAGRRTPRG